MGEKWVLESEVSFLRASTNFEDCIGTCVGVSPDLGRLPPRHAAPCLCLFGPLRLARLFTDEVLVRLEGPETSLSVQRHLGWNIWRISPVNMVGTRPRKAFFLQDTVLPGGGLSRVFWGASCAPFELFLDFSHPTPCTWDHWGRYRLRQLYWWREYFVNE